MDAWSILGEVFGLLEHLRIELEKQDNEIDRLRQKNRYLAAVHDEIASVHIELSDFIKSESDHLRKLVIEHARRLQMLELQQAKMGNAAPPEIIMEIQDIRLRIERMRKKLRQAERRTDFLRGSDDNV